MDDASPPRIRLVTRGDDLGSSRAANVAIAECLCAGVLRNTSVMVPGPAFREAVPMLRGVRDADVGLHVTLNSEWETIKWGPILPPDRVPSLVDEHGHFTSHPRVLDERTARVEEMLAETQAQLDALRAAGVTVNYIDEHMMVGWVNGLRDGLQRLAEREGLVCKHLTGRPNPRGRTGDMLADLESSLRAAPAGTYLYVTHPYALSAADPNDMPSHEQSLRERDRRFCLDPRTAEVLRRNRAIPARYSEV